MDKFGIFNLLNSFFPLNSQNSEQSPTGTSTKGLANNLLSSLGRTLFSQVGTNPNSEQNDQPNTKNQPQKQAVPLPLQKNMILTINSHDEFVKRVKEKHDKLTT